MLYISHIAGPKCFNAMHEDDAGNARGHEMHELKKAVKEDSAPGKNIPP